MLDPSTRTALIDAVRDAARAEVMPRFRRLAPGQIDTKAGPTDLVTEADVAMEDRLRTACATLLPGVAFIGEEGASADPSVLDPLARREEAIVVDPIDGTWNYAHGISGFGTILALTDGAGTAFGLLYDPVIDDWVWAARGDGTHHSNGARLSASPVRDPSEMTGSYSTQGATEDEFARLAAITPRFRKIADLRASLWDYRLLAEGLMEFSVARMLNPWDHAAGALALSEAGGIAMLADGTPYDPSLRRGRLISAAHPAVWQSVRSAYAAVLD